MSEDQTAPVEQAPKPVAEEPVKKDSVAYDTYRKVLSEKKAAHERLQAAESRLSELESSIEASKTQELEEQNRFKELYESVKTENQKLAESIKDRDQRMQDALKIDAFTSSLGDRKIDRKYLGFVDTSKILIDPQTGSVDEISAQKEVERIMAEFPEIVRSSAPSKAMPNAAPRPVGSVKASTMHDKLELLAQHLNQKRRG